MRKVSVCALALMLIAPSAFANKANDILSSMPASKREATLQQFLAASGEPCSSVTRTYYQGMDGGGNAFWNASCSNKKSYAIMIYNNATGSTKILDCKAFKAVAGVDCFKPFK